MREEEGISARTGGQSAPSERRVETSSSERRRLARRSRYREDWLWGKRESADERWATERGLGVRGSGNEVERKKKEGHALCRCAVPTFTCLDPGRSLLSL